MNKLAKDIRARACTKLAGVFTGNSWSEGGTADASLESTARILGLLAGVGVGGLSGAAAAYHAPSKATALAALLGLPVLGGAAGARLGGLPFALNSLSTDDSRELPTEIDLNDEDVQTIVDALLAKSQGMQQ